MTWIPISSLEQLSEIRKRSEQVPQLIFKHRTRCVISVMIKNRLERSEMPSGVDFLYFICKYFFFKNNLSKYADFKE